MRLAYVHENPLPNASAHGVLVLAQMDAFSTLGHDARVVHPWSRRLDPARVAADFALARAPRFVHVPRLRIFGRLGASFFPGAALACRALGTDLVFTENPRAAAACAALGVPVVWDAHAAPNSTRQWRALAALVASPACRGFCFNTAALRRVVEEGGVRHPRTLIAPPGVDLARFAALPERTAARAGLGVPPGGPLIVYAGSMYVGRGVELAIDAVQAMPDARLLAVGGSAADLDRLSASVRSPRIDLRGHVTLPELPVILAAADVLIAPYTSNASAIGGSVKTIAYASPMKLLEYLAAGRPIVASRFPGIEELVEHGTDAWLVAPDDAGALRGGIERVTSDAALARALAERARSEAQQRGWDNRARTLLDAFGDGER